MFGAGEVEGLDLERRLVEDLRLAEDLLLLAHLVVELLQVLRLLLEAHHLLL